MFAVHHHHDLCKFALLVNCTVSTPVITFYFIEYRSNPNPKINVTTIYHDELQWLTYQVKWCQEHNLHTIDLAKQKHFQHIR